MKFKHKKDCMCEACQKQRASLKESNFDNNYIIGTSPERAVEILKDKTGKDFKFTSKNSDSFNGQKVGSFHSDDGDEILFMYDAIKNRIKSINKNTLNEEVTIRINRQEPETDYVISDVTVLDNVEDGDVQSPDIEGLLQLAEQSLQEKYGSNAITIKNLSTTNKMLTEKYQYSIADVDTKEVRQHLKERGIKDACIGNIYLIESTKSGLPRFKVNSMGGTTKYSKVTRNLKEEITRYIESEFLHEASIEFEAKKLQERNAELKELTDLYLSQHPEVKSHVLFINSQIKSYKKLGTLEDVKDNIISDMYGLASFFPLSSKVTDKENNEREFKFENIDEVIKILFGAEWIRKDLKESALPNISKFIYDLDVDRGNAWSAQHYTKNGNGDKIIIVSRNGESENTAEDIKKAVEKKYSKLKGEITENGRGIWFYLQENIDKETNISLHEAYQTFTIGEIEGTFNNQTNEVVYSIPSKNVNDKKLNIADVPDTNQPYDTDTIIKNYIVSNLVSPPQGTEETVDVDETEVVDKENLEEADEDIEVDTPDENIDVDVDDKETQEQAQQETGSAVFFKVKQGAPISLEDLREKALNGVASQQSSYLVIEEKTLSEEDWNNWTKDLSQEENWLVGIKPIDRKNYAFNVVKVSTPSQPYSILVDTVGYSYARYIAMTEGVN